MELSFCLILMMAELQYDEWKAIGKCAQEVLRICTKSAQLVCYISFPSIQFSKLIRSICALLVGVYLKKLA